MKKQAPKTPNSFKSYADAKIKGYKKLKSFLVDEKSFSAPIIITKDLLLKIKNDFEQEIKRRGEDKKLSKIEAKNLKLKLLKNYPFLKPLQAHNTLAIYWFSIKNPSIEFNTEVYEVVKDFRKKSKKWFSQVEPMRFKREASILYLGKVQSQLLNRFIQHIGLGHKSTTSLQLLHWATDLPNNFELEYRFLSVGKEYLDLLEDIEIIMWNEKSPLLGQGKRIKNI